MSTATVPVLQVVIDGRVHDGPPQAPAWNRTGDQMGPAAVQSDLSPPSVV